MKFVSLLGSLLFATTVFAGPIESRFEGIYEVSVHCPGPAEACKQLGDKTTLTIVAGEPTVSDPFGLSLMLRHPKFAMPKFLFFAHRVQAGPSIIGVASSIHQAEIQVQIDPQSLALTATLRSPQYDGEVTLQGNQTAGLGQISSGVSHLSPQQLEGNYVSQAGDQRGILAIRVGFSGRLMALYRIPSLGVILSFSSVSWDPGTGRLTLLHQSIDGGTVKWVFGTSVGQKDEVRLSGLSLSTNTGGGTARVFLKQ